MRDSQKQQVYDAEDVAFYGTALVDRLREPDIESCYRVVIDDPWWNWGSVGIRNARADMTSAGGVAIGRTIKTSAARVHRYTVSHELAHVVVNCERWHDAGHGSCFRRAHIHTVGAIFGEPYAELLAESYEVFGLPVDQSPWRHQLPALPIINIDAFSIATAPTGGWRRPS